MKIALRPPNIVLSKDKNVMELAQIGPFQANLPSLVGCRGLPWKNYFRGYFLKHPCMFIAFCNKSGFVGGCMGCGSQNQCVKHHKTDQH